MIQASKHTVDEWTGIFARYGDSKPVDLSVAAVGCKTVTLANASLDLAQS